jgi:2-phosphoglycerate kinase
MARALVAVGVPLGRAYELAKRIDQFLFDRGEQSIELEQVQELAVEVLGEEEGSEAVRRLRRFRELHELDLPIIVLVGGATGTGKSTVATEAAYRLGITRVTSTDFIRQTMRAFFSEEFMPTIHRSSFAAGEAVVGDVKGDPTVAGFMEQSRLVSVGIDAAIRRALTEGWSIVLEGVHLVPGLIPREVEGALVVHVIVAIPDEETHRLHFHVRDMTTGGIRAMDKYLDHLDAIRTVQTHLVERAIREGMPVVENANVERTIDEVVELVLLAADRVRQAV